MLKVNNFKQILIIDLPKNYNNLIRFDYNYNNFNKIIRITKNIIEDYSM